MVWVATYKGRNQINLARLTANSYGEAFEKAEKVIDFINKHNEEIKINFKFELVDVRRFTSLENWDE